ncbi:hypothetical protein PSHT_06799 [Puccinia striiformis]|uniref:XPG N-terminal domain-containing protein n=1 Tax=Puccinia striiformis TaxID=27350 RepID=A0A2S4W2Z9_9BASI|nr:hypothetical protein PSHT_06799 [Puccinia striiformis]
MGLWTLISLLLVQSISTMGNKKLAIDSSIWLYQFQKHEGSRRKRNCQCPYLGFLRRISKLLYYGIKPVFVLMVVSQHSKDKPFAIVLIVVVLRMKGRNESAACRIIGKTAEKLLAAQLRQVAVMEAQKFSEKKSTKTTSIRSNRYNYYHPIPSPTKKQDSSKDQYQLPIDKIASATGLNRSRSYAKDNDHEFSQTQILNLKKRNNLTQKLLTVTDMVAKANLTIPIKIAAQRNKEYVLVKASEGWILGIENEDEKEETGSIKNPVKVDVEESEDEDVEFEEVKVDRPLRTGKGVASRTSDDEIEFEEVPLPTPTIKLKASREQQEADWREAIRFHYGTTDSNSVVDLKETSVPRPKDDVDLFQQSDEDEVIRDIISEVVAHEAFRPSRDLGEGSSKETTLITLVNKSSDSLKHQFSTSVTGPLSAESCPPVASKQMINILESVELEMDDDFLIPEPLAKPQTAPQIINLESVELEMDDDFLIQEPP